MQAQTSHKNIGLMLFVFACAVMLFAGISVRAQGGYYPNYPNNGGYGGYNNGRYGRVSDHDMRKAYEKGYKRGYDDGKHDARNNRGSYRNGSYGNYGGYGNNGRWGGGQIQRAYQEGYQRGYQEGYDRNRRSNHRYGRYGNRSVFGIPLPY
ncbi:MAG TPA: hypothetical protein VEV84_12195 [Pyrinomonadaceae bacterium]|nr:hypothetical protein [Pyrinomonadaceae bacterium]